MKTTRVFLFLVLVFAAIGLPAYAENPCCTVTGVNAKTGMVMAKETSTGRTFQFKATASLLKTLSAGSPIYANFSSKQVSVNGEVPCCTIMSLSAAGTVATSSKFAPASATLAAPASSAVNSSAPMLSATSHAAGTGFQCDPGSGVCYCTGGKNSADCQALGSDPRCGTKIGCDGIGRCYCAPPKAQAWE
jgi:hypothetical protein